MKNRILRGFRALIVAALLLLGIAVTGLATPSAFAQTIIRVDAQSTATTPDGTTWALAFPKLQDALAAASGSTHIWVRGSASGLSYRPDQGSGFTANDRNATFDMRVNVHVYGGFPDTGNPGFGDRDPATYLTILTGEIGTGNDFSDNSYHVVTADDANMTDLNCRIDGFTITRANAESSGGGGILIANSADLRVDRCTVTDNRSGNGGYGAGIKVDGSNPLITRCVISSNLNLTDEVLYGGGIVVQENSGTSNNPVRILDCTFSANRAAHGGGISVKQTSYATIVNCQINGNSINPTSGNTAP